MSIQDKLSSNKLALSDASTFQGKDNSKNNLETLYLTSSSIYPATYTMLKPKEISQIDTKSRRATDNLNFIPSINFLIGKFDRLKQKHYTKKEIVF
jgi:hypothetical protein